MSSTDNTRHTRLSFMLMTGGEKISKALFDKHVEKQTPANHDPYPWTVDQFLEANKVTILGTQTGKAKMHILFPPENTCSPVEDWDLHLYCFLLIEICGVKRTVRIDIDKLRKMRNKLCHLREPKIDETTYNRKVDELEVIFERLLEELDDQDLKKEVDCTIMTSKKGPLWHEETIFCMHRFYSMSLETQEVMTQQSTGIKSLNEQMSEVLKNQETILKNTSVLPDFQMNNRPETFMELRLKNCSWSMEKYISKILVDMYKETTGQETSDNFNLSEENCKEIMDAVLSTVATFASKGWCITDARQKCVVLLIKCSSVSSLLTLYDDCINGDMNREFRHLESAVRHITGLEEVSLEAVIYEYEFYRAIQETVSVAQEIVSKTYGTKEKSHTELEARTTKGVSDVCFEERKLPDSDDTSLSHQSVRLRLNMDHEGQTQLIKSIKSGSFNCSIDRMKDEICKNYKVTNLSIEAEVIEGENRDEEQWNLKSDESSSRESSTEDEHENGCQEIIDEDKMTLSPNLKSDTCSIATTTLENETSKQDRSIDKLENNTKQKNQQCNEEPNMLQQIGGYLTAAKHFITATVFRLPYQAISTPKESPFTKTPWRQISNWDASFERALIEEIRMIKPVDLTNLLVTGPDEFDTLSFINAVCGIGKGRYEHAPIPEFTTQYTSESLLKGFIFRYTKKFEIKDEFHVDFLNYKINPASPIKPGNECFNVEPHTEAVTHCVIFVINAVAMSNGIPEAFVKKLSILHHKLRLKRVPRTLVLTSADKLCEEVSGNNKLMFRSTKVQKAVKAASKIFGIDQSAIYPVVDNEGCNVLTPEQTIPVLLALRQSLHLANERVEFLSKNKHEFWLERMY